MKKILDTAELYQSQTEQRTCTKAKKLSNFKGQETKILSIRPQLENEESGKHRDESENLGENTIPFS